MMRKLNIFNNLTYNNNQQNRLNNNSNQSQGLNDRNVIGRESKQNNNVGKNNIFPSKKRAISTEKDVINFKKLGKKIESVRSKSNLVENPFYNEDNSNIARIKQNVTVIDVKQNNNVIVQNQVHIPKNLNIKISDEVKIHLKKYMELNAAVNKKAFELNQKNMEIKKKLLEKYAEKKISLYELELIREYSENLADSSEQIKRRKLMELEEKEKFLASKKVQNERILKLKEFFRIEMEKQTKIQEEYNSQIKDLELKMEEVKKTEESILNKNALLRELVEEEIKKKKKIKSAIDCLKIKNDEIQKEKAVNKALKWERLAKIISNYNIFKNFCIVRGYNNSVSKEINEDLISIDNKRSTLIIKTFIENSSSSGVNSINTIPSSNPNNLKTNNLTNKNIKQDVNGFQQISLKFDYIISLFNNKLEEVPLIAEAGHEKDFIDEELEKILDANFTYILNSDSKKNLILTYITEIFNKKNENSGLINHIILSLIEVFIKLINLNTTKIIFDDNKNTSKIINSTFDFNLSIVTKENISKVFEFKRIDSSNNLIFDIDSFSKNIDDLFCDDKEISDSIFGIHLKIISLNNDSQINLLICNANIQDFTLSVLKRAKNMNHKKIKKETNANSNVATLNTEPKNLTTINNQRTLNTTISGMDNIFEEIEMKYGNTYVSFLDITADFDLKEKNYPLYSEENIQEAKKKLNDEFYRSNDDSKIKNKSLRNLSNFDNSPIININQKDQIQNLDSRVKINFSFNMDKLSRESRKMLYSKDTIKYNIEGKTIKEFTKSFC